MTANLAVLERSPFRPLAVEESWDRGLLEEALSLVGYRPKALAEADTVRKRSLAGTIFARALENVGIEPFTIRSVETYKALMVKEAHKTESWRLTRYMHASGVRKMKKGERVAHALGWPAWIGSIGSVLVTSGLHFTGWDTGWGWDAINKKSIPFTCHLSATTAEQIVALPLLALSTWAFLMYLRHKKAIEVRASWNSTGVTDYTSPIPTFAVQRMVSLKKELPEVTFSVQELNVDYQELKTEKNLPTPRPDPFLLAHYKDISCYIDVWDEPRFEGRRTI
jgi:hypothetical protein